MMAVVFLLMATAAPSAAKDGVTALLRSQGLGHLEPRLRSEGLRSACDLELLNDADLVAIGITHLLPRRRLQRAAQQLCARSSEGRRRGLGIEGIKTFSDWPTIPQLYLDGELVGGHDILEEMHAQGELKEMLVPAEK